jgi:hypothetical protein
MGVAWTTLEYKIDPPEAREITISEIKDKCYSKSYKRTAYKDGESDKQYKETY